METDPWRFFQTVTIHRTFSEEMKDNRVGPEKREREREDEAEAGNLKAVRLCQAGAVPCAPAAYGPAHALPEANGTVKEASVSQLPFTLATSASPPGPQEQEQRKESPRKRVLPPRASKEEGELRRVVADILGGYYPHVPKKTVHREHEAVIHPNLTNFINAQDRKLQQQPHKAAAQAGRQQCGCAVADGTCAQYLQASPDDLLMSGRRVTKTMGREASTMTGWRVALLTDHDRPLSSSAAAASSQSSRAPWYGEEGGSDGREGEHEVPGETEPRGQDNLFIIEALLSERTRRRKNEVLVMWKGYGIEHATWEPLENIPAPVVQTFRAGQLPHPDVFDL